MLQPTHLLGLPAPLCLDQIEIAPQTLILSLAMETMVSAGPGGKHGSHRVHCLLRTRADLPRAGKALLLPVGVRRFFCENEACPRKRRAERLPELTSVSARRTTHRKETLAEPGFALHILVWKVLG